MSAEPPNVPASPAFSNFVYVPLDQTSKSSIRLATLLPGDPNSPIRVLLEPAAFADRPRYEALSYTWGLPTPTKTIELNGVLVDVRDNLYTALGYMRSAFVERILWIDAICINQADLDERNHQVGLMAYIYSRAQQVLVWLGEYISYDYDLALQECKGQMLNSTDIQAYPICNQPYWKRVWIVQEIGAATRLEVQWGPQKWTWDKFFQLVRKAAPSNGGLALTLASQRKGRHGDSYLLANLMEACKDSLCEEPRDKVYGFIGIAHDCQDGSLAVDYSKTLFELYEDVVWFQYRSAKLNEKIIVHFSQLTQHLLGGPNQMQEDLIRLRPGSCVPLSSFCSLDDVPNLLKIAGKFNGRISIIGPSYMEIIGVPIATRNWKVALSKCETNMEKLREKNEKFLQVLFEKPLDLSRIFPIDPGFCYKSPIVYLASEDVAQFEAKTAVFKFTANEAVSETSMVLSQSIDPRLFATSGGAIGLIPGNSQEGDMIFQFWNSDTVAVVRLVDRFYLKIIGRAVLADEIYMDSPQFQVPLDGPSHGNMKFLDNNGGTEIYMDIRTLQQMTW